MGGSVLPADQVTPRRPTAPPAAASSSNDSSSAVATVTAEAFEETTPASLLAQQQEQQQEEELLLLLQSGPPPSPKAVGDIVEANYHGRGKWYSGIVAAVNTEPSGTVEGAGAGADADAARYSNSPYTAFHAVLG